MNKSQEYRDNAANCAELAAAAQEGPAHNRYKRMEAAWLALAEEEEWLDGEPLPEENNTEQR
jgi:hypothetical protein